jgi:nucleotide-binding universal stress UspA family protein
MSFSMLQSKDTRMTPHHLLVPIDFSDYAEQALAYAIELAQNLHVRITLLHVIHLTPLAMGDIGATTLLPYLEEMESTAQEYIQAALERVQRAGLEGDSVLIQGIPFQAIIDTAHDRDVDLIVMGTHGRTGLTHVLMGSVAEKVVRLAPCPVLVTRGTAQASTGPDKTA